MHRRSAVFYLLVVLLAPAPILAQGPDPRAHHQLVHHQAEGRVYLIGGSTPRDGGHHYFADTWTWDGTAWTPGPDLPAARSSHGLVYDPINRTLVLFGGTSGGSRNVEGVVMERRDGRWTERARVDEAALGAPGTCMDRRRRRLVIHGGAGPDGSFTAATWEWDGSALARAADGPGARLGHAMAWDPVGEHCLLFGGRDSDGQVRDDTWAWDGREWRRLESEAPTARWIFTMATDPVRGRVVLFGGQDPDGGLLGDTWAWDGASWTRIAAEGPASRMMGAMAFDGEGVILFGGRARAEAGAGYRDRGDTWRLEGSRWRLVGSRLTGQDRLAPGALPPAERPFGTLRELAAMQQSWLEKRLDTFLPALMRRHGIDMWVVPMREYNEDPIFSSITAPETFAARRRTIYVFFDTCAAAGTPVNASCVEKIALGGTSQGGVFDARRSALVAAAPVAGRQAELWGDEQWQLLKQVIEERKPSVIGINRSTVFAFNDGLSSGELQGMTEALGPGWTSKFRNAEGLPLELIASRLPEEEAFFEKMNAHVWQMTQTMFSEKVIVPGVTRTSDLVWWWRQRVADQGLATWFQPSVSIQRQGATSDDLGSDPVILPGDVLHCDVGITVARLNTDTQHNAYVLKPGETDAPAGLKQALANANAMQDIAMEEIRPGRTGNEILKSVLSRMEAQGINGTMYSHPIGTHGHGAGPLIGLWDRQQGVPGRGDAPVIPSMWWSIELQATTPVPEWGGQPVRMAQEEDMIIGADGKTRWAFGRQDRLFLVRGQVGGEVRRP